MNLRNKLEERLGPGSSVTTGVTAWLAAACNSQTASTVTYRGVIEDYCIVNLCISGGTDKNVCAGTDKNVCATGNLNVDKGLA